MIIRLHLIFFNLHTLLISIGYETIAFFILIIKLFGDGLTLGVDVCLIETKNRLEYQSTSDFDRRINQSLIKLIKTNPEVAELEENLKNMRKQSKNKTDFLLDGINHAFSFIVNTFGEGQELIALMINLLSSHHFVLFITMFPSPIFLKYNESLLIDKKNKQLLLEIEALGVQEVLD